MLAEGQYPQLSHGEVTHTIEGAGTAEDPYRIRTARDLGAVNTNIWAHYRLMNDIDLSEMGWLNAVITSFAGSFDGDHHVIHNVMIHQIIALRRVIHFVNLSVG